MANTNKTRFQLDSSTIRDRLNKHEINRLQPESDFPEEILKGRTKRAAILIPLFFYQDEWHLLYTRRNENLSEHGGQVAFPGGMVSDDDPDLETTALREANEEIGLRPEDVRLLGRLHDFLTITNYRVTPFVGQIPWPYTFTLSEDEVAHIFSIPLSWLNDPCNREDRIRQLPVPYPTISVTYFNPYQGQILWGASARFTLALLEVLK